MSESVDTTQIAEEATAAASLTISLTESGQPSLEMSVGREHAGSLLVLFSHVLMALVVIAGLSFSVIEMASAGLSEWLITAVVAMETVLLMALRNRTARASAPARRERQGESDGPSGVLDPADQPHVGGTVTL